MVLGKWKKVLMPYLLRSDVLSADVFGVEGRQLDQGPTPTACIIRISAIKFYSS
jgi:hypothetical protein